MKLDNLIEVKEGVVNVAFFKLQTAKLCWQRSRECIPVLFIDLLHRHKRCGSEELNIIF